MLRKFAIASLTVVLPVSTFLHADMFDHGLRDTSKNSSEVVYADGEFVYLKTCDVPSSSPDRYCESSTDPIKMKRSLYLKFLNRNTGLYSLDQAGLELAKQDLAAAQAAGTDNAGAVAEVSRLETVVSNIEEILEVNRNLEEAEYQLHYQFNESYRFVREGFIAAMKRLYFDETTNQFFAISHFKMTKSKAYMVCKSLEGGDWTLATSESLLNSDGLGKRLKNVFSSALPSQVTISGARFLGFWVSDIGKSFRIRMSSGPLCSQDENDPENMCTYNETTYYRTYALCRADGGEE